MSKILLIAAFLTVAASVQGAPLSPYDEIAEAAAAGEWNKVQTLIAKNFAKDGLQDLGTVKDLKPPKGGHVYGESQYTFHSLSDIGGHTSEKSGGHKIINDDGKVEEFDFKPAEKPDEFFKKLGFKPFSQS